MSILSRYIGQEFIKYFVVFMIGFVMIVTIGNFFSRLGDAFSGVEQFLAFVKETVSLWPILLELVIPITVLLATITTFSALNRTSEIVAMRTAGVSQFQLAKPILGICLVISFFSYFNQNYLYSWLQKHWGPEETSVELPPLWKIGGDAIYYFGKRQIPAEVQDVSIFSWSKTPYQVTERTRIDQGILRSDVWHFKTLQKRLFSKDGSEWKQSEEQITPKTEFPPVPFEKTIDPHHYPLLSLYQVSLSLQEEGHDVTKHWVELHQKVAYPFTLFIMCLIGLSLSLSHSRHGKAAEGMAISVLLGILFWISNQIFLAIGGAGMLWPALAAWASNLIFLGIALLFIRFYRS